MAIKVNGTTVLNDSRALTNITSADATTVAALNTAGVGGGGTAPTTGTSYEIAWGTGVPETEFLFYENDYSPTPGPSHASYKSSGGPLSFSFIAMIDGAATFRVKFRSRYGVGPVFFRVVKNGSQVQESSTTTQTLTNFDINSSFSKGDLLQVQVRARNYGEDVGFEYCKVLSGTNARGALMFQ